MDPVVHFELPVEDIARAQRFYQQAFGWATAQPPGVGFAFCTTSEADPATRQPKVPGQVNGSMLQRRSFLQHPLVTIRVADMEAALAAVAAAGGSALSPKRDVGPFWACYVRDPEGNVVGLIQPK